MKLSAIAQAIDAVVTGDDGNLEIRQLSSPELAGTSDIVFLSSAKYRDSVAQCNAVAVILKRGESIRGKVCLEVDDPYTGYAKAAQLFENRAPVFNNGISPHAIIDSTASLDPTVSVGPLSVIGANVTVGKGCRIEANCVIEKDSRIGRDCRIDSGAVIRWGTVMGDRVVVQSGAVIGSDGFGNARQKDGSWVRIPCFGVVEIGDDVEVGAGTTIDRGNFKPTVIGSGVKLDNLIQIAHNVAIGDFTAIASQTGISGSTRLGKRVIIGGQAGFVGHIEIGDDTFVGAKAGVSKGSAPNSKITGYPARDLMAMRRIEASQQHLPDLLKEVKNLRRELEKLKSSQV